MKFLIIFKYSPTARMLTFKLSNGDIFHSTYKGHFLLVNSILEEHAAPIFRVEEVR